MADIRDRPFRLAPELVPQGLIGKVAACPVCPQTAPIPWTDKLELPSTSLRIRAGSWLFPRTNLHAIESAGATCGNGAQAHRLRPPRSFGLPSSAKEGQPCRRSQLFGRINMM
jgi:hypothetical protein